MSEIVAWHLQGREQIKIYDPTSGSGSLLIHIGQSVARRNGNPNSIMYYAQELKENTYNLTRMNLVMRGILPDNIVARNGDTLGRRLAVVRHVGEQGGNIQSVVRGCGGLQPSYSQMGSH